MFVLYCLGYPKTRKNERKTNYQNRTQNLTMLTFNKVGQAQSNLLPSSIVFGFVERYKTTFYTYCRNFFQLSSRSKVYNKD